MTQSSPSDDRLELSDGTVIENPGKLGRAFYDAAEKLSSWLAGQEPDPYVSLEDRRSWRRQRFADRFFPEAPKALRFHSPTPLKAPQPTETHLQLLDEHLREKGPGSTSHPIPPVPADSLSRRARRSLIRERRALRRGLPKTQRNGKDGEGGRNRTKKGAKGRKKQKKESSAVKRLSTRGGGVSMVQLPAIASARTKFEMDFDTRMVSDGSKRTKALVLRYTCAAPLHVLAVHSTYTYGLYMVNPFVLSQVSNAQSAITAITNGFARYRYSHLKVYVHGTSGTNAKGEVVIGYFADPSNLNTTQITADSAGFSEIESTPASLSGELGVPMVLDLSPHLGDGWYWSNRLSTLGAYSQLSAESARMEDQGGFVIMAYNSDPADDVAIGVSIEAELELISFGTNLNANSLTTPGPVFNCSSGHPGFESRLPTFEVLPPEEEKKDDDSESFHKVQTVSSPTPSSVYSSMSRILKR